MESNYPDLTQKTSLLAKDLSASSPAGKVTANLNSTAWRKIWVSRGFVIAVALLLVALIADGILTGAVPQKPAELLKTASP